MLVRFTVENFMSFRDKTEFNMLTSPEAKYRRHKDHVTEINGVELLRGAAIYGANGSGKSNLVQAINIVKTLFVQEEMPSNSRAFYFRLNNQFSNKPVKFWIEVCISKRFFELSLELDNNHYVRYECLKEIFPNKKELSEIIIYEKIFSTEGKWDLNINPNYLNEGKHDSIIFKLILDNFKKHNTLIIHALKGNGIEPIDFFYGFTGSLLPVVTSIRESYGNGLLLHLFTQIPSMIVLLNEFISAADIGITRFEIESHDFESFFGINESDKAQLVKNKLDSGAPYQTLATVYNWAIAIREGEEYVVKSIAFYHKTADGKDERFITWYESEGTLTYLCLAAIIVSALLSDLTFIIDEIEQSLHPLLVKELIKKFMDSNWAQGQLIFTTHDTNLLDLGIFRQDEIWFTEKDKEGASHMYPLSDFNPRYDLDIEKGYLNGRFGAIPFLGNLDDLELENAKQG